MKVLRKIRNKIKEKVMKVLQKKSSLKLKKSMPEKKEKKKEFLGAQKVVVEQAKFYTHQIPPRPAARVMPADLPSAYGQHKIVLQVRDPWWIHAYWEIRTEAFENLKAELGNGFYAAKRILRVYDVSHIVFDGTNAHRFFDIPVGESANNWYIDTGAPGRSWCVDFGLLLPDGRFITIVRSNTVYTPLDGPSWITDEEWMIPEEMFARLYGMGFGFGQSSPVGKAWQERIQRALFSGALASPGMASMASPVKKMPKERNFWLVVDCELIVYGATEPDAKLTVRDKEIKLRPDGTFTLRYALPDGKQIIPVKAVSSDNIEERSITPMVSRETKSGRLVKQS